MTLIVDFVIFAAFFVLLTVLLVWIFQQDERDTAHFHARLQAEHRMHHSPREPHRTQRSAHQHASSPELAPHLSDVR